MTVYDLTRTVGAGTMAYPGTEPPRLKVMNTIEQDGFQETLLTLFSHSGTHMDAPAHMLAGAAYLNELDASRFCGKAYVLDCSAYVEAGEIPASALPDLTGLDFLLLSSGWEENWGKEAYFGRFPVLSEEAARAVVKAGLKGVGVDMMSVDPMDTVTFPVHMTLFRAGMVIVENLCDLVPLRGKTLRLCALPMKYERADGAPTRAVAWEE